MARKTKNTEVQTISIEIDTSSWAAAQDSIDAALEQLQDLAAQFIVQALDSGEHTVSEIADTMNRDRRWVKRRVERVGRDISDFRQSTLDEPGAGPVRKRAAKKAAKPAAKSAAKKAAKPAAKSGKKAAAAASKSSRSIKLNVKR